MPHSLAFFLTTSLVWGAQAGLPGRAEATEFGGRYSAWVAPENPKCTCRFKGEHLELGALRCLNTTAGPRMHECVTEQNITSWRPRKEACPQASLGLSSG